MFKLGKHQGSLEKLISRYNTYLPDVKICYFQYIDDAAKTEDN
ncbi:hypothetical protein [Acanthamoeba castellanii mimivirus]|nr:hypothetical protein MIMI-R10 [Acanthamoeba polyphaga mimivirus]BAV61084.1 hypothetical protein [Acanthamoeba castellanii mimivirus]BAV62072.1 hypothetical protein [Acanthamoeba castellanii mimivirus]